MTFTFRNSAIPAAALLVLCFATAAAQAVTLRVRCDSFPDRSRASVDGNDLAPGRYRAVLTSGSHTSRSPLQAAQGDEAEFDFDSDRGDVREGATKIGRGFIVDDSVTGTLLDVDGNVVATKTQACKSH